MTREDFLSSISQEEAEEFCRIEDLMETFDDLPDGAFFGILSEYGVEAEDLAWFYDMESQIDE